MSLMSMFPGGGGTNNQPLKAPTNLNVVMNTPTSAQITWTDPENEYSQPSGQLIGEWMFTRIVRKIGSAPVNANDGELIVESAVKNQYQSTPFVDSNGIVTGTKYYYAAFAFTKTRVQSPGAFFEITASWYDPVLANNTWAMINQACSEGVAPTLWSRGDTKTDGGRTYEILTFNPSQYPLSDGSGTPVIIFGVTQPVGNVRYAPSGVHELGPPDYYPSDNVRMYRNSYLKAQIDAQYNNSITDELRPFIRQVKLTTRALKTTLVNYELPGGSITQRYPEYNETDDVYTFPPGIRYTSLYPTQSSRAKNAMWWTGDVSSDYTGNIYRGYFKADVIDTDGNLEVTNYVHGDTQSETHAFIYCFGLGKAGA